MVDVVDMFTFGIPWLILTVALWYVIPGVVMVGLWVALAFLYFVVLKKSRFGTLGYRLGGVKIVGLNGDSPSLGSLFVRMTFLFLGPTNYLFDLIWLSGDPHKQALRDKFAQTYVVRRSASPIGPAKVIWRQYYILGWSCLVREIAAAGGSASA
jgi:uncharacterized RDD family membrane protein YckC